MPNKFDSFLQFQQSFTAELLKQQNKKLVKNAVHQNEEIKRLQKQISETDKLNKQILRNQQLEIEKKETQKFHKSFIFLSKQIIEKINTADLEVKTYFSRNYLPKLKSTLLDSLNNLDEFTDKEYCSKVINQIDNLITTDNEGYFNSTLFQLEEAVNSFEKIKAPNPIVLQDSRKDIKPKYRKTRLFFEALIVICLFISIINGIKNPENFEDTEIKIFSSIYFLLAIAVIVIIIYREVKWIKGYADYLKPFNEIEAKHSIKIDEYQNKINNHVIHQLYEDVLNTNPEFNAILTEIKKLSTH